MKKAYIAPMAKKVNFEFCNNVVASGCGNGGWINSFSWGQATCKYFIPEMLVGSWSARSSCTDSDVTTTYDN